MSDQQRQQQHPSLPPPRLIADLASKCHQGSRACEPPQKRHIESSSTRQSCPDLLAAAAAAAAATVAVIAPGAGTFANGSVYNELQRRKDFVVEIVGQGRAPYDRYPQWFPQGGCPAPNLDTFAGEVLERRAAQRADCLVLGSRGGQVVLPRIWQTLGDSAPPAVVINGGCAMGLPRPVQWPERAVTFLLMGGQDSFRGNKTPEEYLADAKSRVPAANGTTAILYVNEMQHMPQSSLLAAVLPHMLRAILAWRAAGKTTREELKAVLAAVSKEGCWSGRLLHTAAPGGAWLDAPFGHGSAAAQAEARKRPRLVSGSAASSSAAARGGA